MHVFRYGLDGEDNVASINVLDRQTYKDLKRVF
jgi:hypothetical protein